MQECEDTQIVAHIYRSMSTHMVGQIYGSIVYYHICPTILYYVCYYLCVLAILPYICPTILYYHIARTDI